MWHRKMPQHSLPGSGTNLAKDGVALHVHCTEHLSYAKSLSAVSGAQFQLQDMRLGDKSVGL